MKCKILRLFFNILSADGKYSLLNTDNLTQPIQMELSQNIFKKKVTLIAEVFPKSRAPKNLVRSISKKSRFKGSFRKQHGKRPQTLLKFAWKHLYHVHGSLRRQLTCKKSLLVICKISGLFLNTLSADGQYSVFNTANLTQRIQMRVSRK